MIRKNFFAKSNLIACLAHVIETEEKCSCWTHSENIVKTSAFIGLNLIIDDRSIKLPVYYLFYLSLRLTTMPLLCRLSVWDIRISVITVQIMRCVSRFISLTTGCRPNQYKGLGWFGRGRGWRGVRNETHSAFTVVPLTLVPSWSTSLPFICNRKMYYYI